MSTDRELLELSAKAAGIVGEYVERKWIVTDNESSHFTGIQTGRETVWNPLEPLGTDDPDGEALRLAVKLHMSSLMIFPSNGDKLREVWVPNSGYDGGMVAETTEAEYAADPYVATRRAIVRAAAAIGKEMP